MLSIDVMAQKADGGDLKGCTCVIFQDVYAGQCTNVIEL